MFIKFTIDHSKEKKSEYTYSDVNLFSKGPFFSKEKKGTQWEYEITDTNGVVYHLNYQRRPVVGLRPGKVVYAIVQPNNRIIDLYTTGQEFFSRVRKQIVREEERVAAGLVEIERLKGLSNK